MVNFSGIFDTGQVRNVLDDERQINRWKGIGSRFKDKLIKMIKNINGRFDDYSIFIALEL